MSKFDLWTVYDGEAVRVTGRVSPGRAATMEDPPEPAEIEDFKVYAEDGTEMEDPDGDIFNALEDSIMEAVSEAVVADMHDAADRRYDEERDR